VQGVLFRCDRCGGTIRPDERAVWYVRDVIVRDAGSIDPSGVRRERAITHERHELGREYREAKRGILRDLTAG